MKRDFDLIRKILDQIEEKSDGLSCGELDLPDHAAEEVWYQVMLLKQAGLIEAADCRSRAGNRWLPQSLTWDGHEFLDAIKNDTVWTQVKTTVKEKGGVVPFEILKALAIQFGMSFCGIG